MHHDVFRLASPESSDEDSSWPFGFSSINSREKIDTSAEDGEILGRDTEPLGKYLSRRRVIAWKYN